MLDSVYKAAPVFLFALLAGCVAAPVKHALPVTEPLPLRLAVEMTPEQLARRTQYFYYYYLFCSEEGLLTQRAALAAFTPLVSQVLPREQMPVPDVIVKVSSKGLFNPLMRVFYADVSATAYLPNGAELGTFQASSEVSAHPYGYERAFQSAYLAAFQDIGTKLVQSGSLSAAVH